MIGLLDDGVVGGGSDIAQGEGLHHSTVNELVRLTLLEPAIIQSILAGLRALDHPCHITAAFGALAHQQQVATLGGNRFPALAGWLGESGQ